MILNQKNRMALIYVINDILLDNSTPLAYNKHMDIEETSFFTKHLYEYLSDDEYGELQMALYKTPELGRTMPGTNGIRKLRWGANNKGKRGGCRIIYYWFNLKDKLLMMYIYPKNEQKDLSPEQLKVLSIIVEEEKGRSK